MITPCTDFELHWMKNKKKHKKLAYQKAHIKNDVIVTSHSHNMTQDCFPGRFLDTLPLCKIWVV